MDVYSFDPCWEFQCCLLISKFSLGWSEHTAHPTDSQLMLLTRPDWLSSIHLTTSRHRCPSVEKRWSRDQPAELPVSSVFFNHMTCILRDLSHTHARVHHCCHTHSWWTRAHNHDGQGQVSNPKLHAECMLCLQRWSHLSNRLFPPVCELTVQTWIYAD